MVVASLIWGFILYDLFIKNTLGSVTGIESRNELVQNTKRFGT